MVELEREVAALRASASSGQQSDVVLEETASQTDPPHWTVDSGIQVDFHNTMPTSRTQSCADTDSVSEDLPFDGDLSVHTPVPAQPSSKEALVSAFFVELMSLV